LQSNNVYSASAIANIRSGGKLAGDIEVRRIKENSNLQSLAGYKREAMQVIRGGGRAALTQLWGVIDGRTMEPVLAANALDIETSRVQAIAKRENPLNYKRSGQEALKHANTFSGQADYDRIKTNTEMYSLVQYKQPVVQAHSFGGQADYDRIKTNSQMYSFAKYKESGESAHKIANSFGDQWRSNHVKMLAELNSKLAYVQPVKQAHGFAGQADAKRIRDNTVYQSQNQYRADAAAAVRRGGTVPVDDLEIQRVQARSKAQSDVEYSCSGKADLRAAHVTRSIEYDRLDGLSKHASSVEHERRALLEQAEEEAHARARGRVEGEEETSRQPRSRLPFIAELSSIIGSGRSRSRPESADVAHAAVAAPEGGGGGDDQDDRPNEDEELRSMLALSAADMGAYNMLWEQVRSRTTSASHEVDVAIPKKVAMQFLRTSALSQIAVKRVWNSARAIAADGKMRRCELFTAVKLVALIQAGKKSSMLELRKLAPLPVIGFLGGAPMENRAAPSQQIAVADDAESDDSSSSSSSSNSSSNSSSAFDGHEGQRANAQLTQPPRPSSAFAAARKAVRIEKVGRKSAEMAEQWPMEGHVSSASESAGAGAGASASAEMGTYIRSNVEEAHGPLDAEQHWLAADDEPTWERNGAAEEANRNAERRVSAAKAALLAVAEQAKLNARAKHIVQRSPQSLKVGRAPLGVVHLLSAGERRDQQTDTAAGLDQLLADICESTLEATQMRQFKTSANVAAVDTAAVEAAAVEAAAIEAAAVEAAAIEAAAVEAAAIEAAAVEAAAVEAAAIEAAAIEAAAVEAAAIEAAAVEAAAIEAAAVEAAAIEAAAVEAAAIEATTIEAAAVEAAAVEAAAVEATKMKAASMKVAAMEAVEAAAMETAAVEVEVDTTGIAAANAAGSVQRPSLVPAFRSTLAEGTSAATLPISPTLSAETYCKRMKVRARIRRANQSLDKMGITAAALEEWGRLYGGGAQMSSTASTVRAPLLATTMEQHNLALSPTAHESKHLAQATSRRELVVGEAVAAVENVGELEAAAAACDAEQSQRTMNETATLAELEANVLVQVEQVMLEEAAKVESAYADAEVTRLKSEADKAALAARLFTRKAERKAEKAKLQLSP
jgi:hypothetical protein